MNPDQIRKEVELMIKFFNENKNQFKKLSHILMAFPDPVRRVDVLLDVSWLDESPDTPPYIELTVDHPDGGMPMTEQGSDMDALFDWLKGALCSIRNQKEGEIFTVTVGECKGYPYPTYHFKVYSGKELIAYRDDLDSLEEARAAITELAFIHGWTITCNNNDEGE